MYQNCCSERAAEKQRRLELCLLDLLQTELYDNISVSALCAKSGVSRKTFYRLFDGKADVIYALVDHTLMEFAHYEPEVKEGFGEIHRMLAFFKAQKPLLDALQNNRISTLLTERSLRLILTENTGFQERFGVEKPEYAMEMMLFYVSGIFSLILAWHASGYARSVDEMADLLSTLMQKSPMQPYEK